MQNEEKGILKAVGKLPTATGKLPVLPGRRKEKVRSFCFYR